jgi:PEP-CTERM motif-containing protein
MRSVSVLVALVGVAVVTVMAPRALAGPVYSVSGGSFQNGSDTVTLTRPDGVVETGLAGQMTIQLRDTVTGAIKTVQAYCTDIFDYLSLPATFTRGLLSDTVSTSRVSQINALIANGNAGATSADASAALQMAIWEFQNETSGHYDVTTGALMVSGPANAVALANQDIQNVLNGVWKADPRLTIYQITAPGNQSLSYAEAVPEPATLAIFGTGLVLLLGFRRTRRSPPLGIDNILA